jgi:sodium/potassium-transporting ATPase subunit alpha
MRSAIIIPIIIVEISLAGLLLHKHITTLIFPILIYTLIFPILIYTQHMGGNKKSPVHSGGDRFSDIFRNCDHHSISLEEL